MANTKSNPLTSANLIKAEIIRQQLYNIAQEMGIVMIRTSGDPVISEAVDFSTFIADKDGEIISFSGYMTMHAGPARQAVRHILATYSQEDIKPGDAFICNDPHTTGACHPPDVGIVKPIFYDGNLVAWCWAEGHLLDVGGMSPGGFAVTATEAYQEALRFPGIKIVSEGKIVQDIFHLLQANFRMPQHDMNNIRCFIAACNICEKRTIDMIDKYGLEEFNKYVELNKELSEKAYRERIAKLPDKTYEATEWIEHNGHENKLWPVHCKLTIQGDNITLDFTGTAPQTDGFVNISEGTAIGCLMTPIMLVLTPDIPFNEGIIRATNMILPEGTVINCKMPAPVSSGHMEAGMRVTKVVTELLSRAMIESEDEWVRSHAMACFHDSWVVGVFAGNDREGKPVVFLDMNGGGAGGGAQTVSDGLDAAASFTQLSNGLPDIEINELTNPILYLWRKLNVNSGGPGKYRGGQGIEFGWIPWGTEGGNELISSACSQVPARGIMGGYPGGTSGHWIVRNANVENLMKTGTLPSFEQLKGEKELQPFKHVTPISQGDVFVQFEGGGGGLGDPLKRNPEVVLKDFNDGYITQEMAETAYGIVIDEKGNLDEERTKTRRELIRRERLGQSAPPKQKLIVKKSLKFVKSAGDALQVSADSNGQRYMCCSDCGTVLSNIEEAWEQGAGRIVTKASETLGNFGMFLKVKDTAPYVKLQELICPECGTMLGATTSVNE
ncbi:hydantoinase B/oxoprolinase family protein [Paenibacillus sp. BSR1-1]|uniref:hydantoinase B/oxoprolinase family protein n=1 Tax=Paenibacillus sp. BSR1-1 TaxID=3020845 RepID=UPI0025AF93B3|nr:hydantoinase B/oxoprolinase family protein [Paenibacillus sp. BSR1-1]MDN3016192.1 hydantoinase B/oxoprolinase family protein [Paenibacillus sp. BSR1-1]